jgi:gas vesicle protein
MRRLIAHRLLGGLLVGALVVAGTLAGSRPGRGEDAKKTPDPKAVEQAREKVKMLDDVYKGFVVHITDTYVRAQETTPAARVTQKVFKHMQTNGWHSARLIDATGAPLNKKNAPTGDFEKRAIEQLKAGKTYFEEVGVKNEQPVLRAATIVPVVMKQCITCHPGNKEGDLMGAIIYEMPIK